MGGITLEKCANDDALQIFMRVVVSRRDESVLLPLCGTRTGSESREAPRGHVLEGFSQGSPKRQSVLGHRQHSRKVWGRQRRWGSGDFPEHF